MFDDGSRARPPLLNLTAQLTPDRRSLGAMSPLDHAAIYQRNPVTLESVVAPVKEALAVVAEVRATAALAPLLRARETAAEPLDSLLQSVQHAFADQTETPVFHYPAEGTLKSARIDAVASLLTSALGTLEERAQGRPTFSQEAVESLLLHHDLRAAGKTVSRGYVGDYGTEEDLAWAALGAVKDDYLARVGHDAVALPIRHTTDANEATVYRLEAEVDARAQVMNVVRELSMRAGETALGRDALFLHLAREVMTGVWGSPAEAVDSLKREVVGAESSSLRRLVGSAKLDDGEVRRLLKVDDLRDFVRTARAELDPDPLAPQNHPLERWVRGHDLLPGGVAWQRGV